MAASVCVYMCVRTYAWQELYFKKVSSQDEKLYPWTKVRDGRNEGWLVAAAESERQRGGWREEGSGIGLHNGIVCYNDKREQ